MWISPKPSLSYVAIRNRSWPTTAPISLVDGSITLPYEKGVELQFMKPGKPSQNAFVESFNGRFRDECLNQHWFITLADTQCIIKQWRQDYNTVLLNRPGFSGDCFS